MRSSIGWSCAVLNAAMKFEEYEAAVDLEVEVYDFTLPDRMTCTTAFGFSTHNVWRYQNLQEETQQRAVLDKYWANFSRHRISPYDPAPLDGILDDWPEVKRVPQNPSLTCRKFKLHRKILMAFFALLLLSHMLHQNY